jgi:histidinol-phosphatase (PHP family)
VKRLAENDSPVAGLDPRVEPRVFVRDGFAITMWTYFAPVRRMLPPAGYAQVLECLHAGLRQIDVPTPHFMGEPHRHPGACARVLAAGRFDRVLGSLHSLPDQGSFAEPWGIYPHRDAHDVVREYLADLITMVAQSDVFSVLAHIDYPIRFWPAEREGPFGPAVLEGEFRAALRATAQSGRALEISTRLPRGTRRRGHVRK